PREHYALARELMILRRWDPLLSAGDARVDGAVLSEHAFVLRYFAGDADRLLVVNLGPDLLLGIAPEPLLAPLDRRRGWRRLWHSEDACYGGGGAGGIRSGDGLWGITAGCGQPLAGEGGQGGRRRGPESAR